MANDYKRQMLQAQLQVPCLGNALNQNGNGLAKEMDGIVSAAGLTCGGQRHDDQLSPTLPTSLICLTELLALLPQSPPFLDLRIRAAVGGLPHKPCHAFTTPHTSHE